MNYQQTKQCQGLRGFRMHIVWLVPFLVLCLIFTGNAEAARRRTFTVEVQRPMDAAPTSFTVYPALMSSTFGRGDTDRVADALGAGSLKLLATHTGQSGKESFYSTSTLTSGYGQWFTSSGVATTEEKIRCISIAFDVAAFHIAHNTADGAFFDWREHTLHFGYDFHIEYPDLPKPEMPHVIHKRGSNEPANMYAGERRCNQSSRNKDRL